MSESKQKVSAAPAEESAKKYQLRLTSREVQTLSFAISRTFNFEEALSIDNEDQAEIWEVYKKLTALRTKIWNM